MSAGAVKYRYAQNNLLAERYHYMYTPYEGPDFLRAYLEQRQALCGELSAVRQQLLAEPSTDVAISEEIRRVVLGNSADLGTQPLRDRAIEVLPAQPGHCGFDTRSVLLDLWHCFAYDVQRSVRECPGWVDFLHRRFEVTKRLNIRYNASLKPTTRVTRRPDSYALLAAMLMYRYREDNNLKYVNAVLKLVDLLSSVGLDSQDPLTQLTTLVAIEAELAAVQGLLACHGIEL